jgi:lysophospholipase L1-like esterase
MRSLKLAVYVALTLMLFSCSISDKKNMMYLPDNPAIRYCGRIDFIDPLKPRLSNAGAFFSFTIKGNSCSILLENQYEEPNHNYISIAIDGKYTGRIKIEKGIKKYSIAENLETGKHLILVCKATESFIGYIELLGIQCRKILISEPLPSRKIEFIGNSITSGAEMDTTFFTCDSGVWHDRHNAYMAYGPVVSRALNAQWVLSSISGMGLTRNWNNEGPGVPSFYDNLYLDADSTKPWANDYDPDLVTICLGTNDISPGDGSYDRKPLDSTNFVNAYVQFLAHLRSRYPNSTLCLINGPVFGEADREKFRNYLESTVSTYKKLTSDQRIFSFTYSNTYGKGCSGHPNLEEHQMMAEELIPFLKEIMNW